MEAVAWRYSQNAETYIALQNTTKNAVVAIPTIFALGRRITLDKRQLKPRQTTIVKLPASETSLTSEGPQSVGVRIEYNGKPGAVVAQGRVIDTVVNLRKYQEDGLFPLSVEMGAIDLQYKGERGALVAEAASVDQNGSFVSPVPLTCNGNPDQHMTFWRTDGDWHSSITVENISSQDSDLQITVSYPSGIYVFEKNIAPHKTIMVSINELQQSQEPDSAGCRIPLDATFGGVNIWDRNVNKGLIINAMLINPVTKTCQSCSDDGYAYTAYPIEDYRDCYNTGAFEAHQVGDQFGLKMSVQWSSGNRSCDLPNYSTLISNTPSVANLSGTTMICYGPGSTPISPVAHKAYGRLTLNAQVSAPYSGMAFFRL